MEKERKAPLRHLILIKHQKNFKRDNKFSRTEYEKFLIKNNITATNFEYILSNEEKKKQLLEFIGGGILPPKFLKINTKYILPLWSRFFGVNI